MSPFPRKPFIVVATFGYAIIATLWILLSDYLLSGLVEPHTMALFGAGKGILFVCITTILLFFALRHVSERDSSPGPATPRYLFIAILTGTLVISFITILSFFLQTARLKEGQFAQLRAVSQLKTDGLETWLGERRGDSLMISRNPNTVASLVAYLNTGDAQHRARLIGQLDLAQSSYGYAGVHILDFRGRPILSGGASANPRGGPLLVEALKKSLIAKSPVLVDLHRQSDGLIHMGLVAPIINPATGQETFIGGLYSDILPETFLFPHIQKWPLPGKTGETILARQEGSDILYLNELLHRPGSALAFRIPAATPDLPAAKALQAGELTGAGTDYRGVQVFYSARLIPDTPWVLVAKIDQEEALEGVFTMGAATAALGLLAVTSVLVSIAYLWQRQRSIAIEAALHHANALASLRQRMQALFENMLDGYAYCRMIFEGDTAVDFEYLEVNPAFETLTGLKGVVGQRVTEVIPGFRDTGSELLQIYGRVARSGNPERLETYLPSLNLWLSIAVYGVEPGHFVAVFDNITERKIALQSLKQISLLYQALSDTNQMIVRTQDEEQLFDSICKIVLNLDTLQLAWIGMRENEEPVLRPRAAAGPQAMAILQSTVPLESEQGGDLSLPARAFKEERTRTRDDFDADPPPPQWANHLSASGLGSAACLPIRRSEKVVGVFTVASPEKHYFDKQKLQLFEEMALDISFGLDNIDRNRELRQTLEDLRETRDSLEIRVIERTKELQRAKERAESADRVKTAFLSSMSHELRTPLNSIIGFTGVLLQQLPGPLNAEQVKQLAIVQDAGRQLLALISDVLDISRIEAGKLRLEEAPVDLKNLLAKVEAAFRPECERKGLDLRMDISEALPTIRGDANRLDQIANNLLSNAIKFTDNGSITVHCRVDGKQILIQVDDTGIGILPEDQDRLFKPFSQLDRSHRGQGTGLGLAICSHLVQTMGGKIQLTSKPGQGSSFAVRLPLKEHES